MDFPLRGERREDWARESHPDGRAVAWRRSVAPVGPVPGVTPLLRVPRDPSETYGFSCGPPTAPDPTGDAATLPGPTRVRPDERPDASAAPRHGPGASFLRRATDSSLRLPRPLSCHSDSATEEPHLGRQYQLVAVVPGVFGGLMPGRIACRRKPLALHAARIRLPSSRQPRPSPVASGSSGPPAAASPLARPQYFRQCVHVSRDVALRVFTDLHQPPHGPPTEIGTGPTTWGASCPAQRAMNVIRTR